MPSEPKLQFFTPDLYRRYNSSDDSIALAADAECEAAIVQYHKHLAQLQEKMRPPVPDLSKLCLHDGEILPRQEQQHPLGVGLPEEAPDFRPFWPFWYGLATLAVRLDDELVTTFYFLTDYMTEQPPTESWSFSKQREHWLYDEVHGQSAPRGTFSHVVLLSSGVVLTIPFATVSISRFALLPAATERDKQSA